MDAAGFPAVADRDPVVGQLMGAYPGLRPVGFHSPCEAACWAAVGQRLRITQAAGVVVAELASVAEARSPYRTWVSVLLRVDREATTGEIARGRRS